jgi:hypothetical protein
MVRLNLLDSITEGIKYSQMTKSKYKKRKCKTSELLLASLIQESASDKSIEIARNIDLAHENSMKRMITFSSELDHFTNQKSNTEGDPSNPKLDEFEEYWNLSQKINIYDHDMCGGTWEDLMASKNKMNISEYKWQVFSPQHINSNSMKRKSVANQALLIFGLNTKMQRVPSKYLEEKESPKFSTCSDKEENSSLKPNKKQKLLRRSTFSNQKISEKNYPTKDKRWFLVDKNTEVTATLKMICQTLNCKLDIATNTFSAVNIFEAHIK